MFFTCQVSACELQPFSCHDLAKDIYSQTPKTVFSHLNGGATVLNENDWDSCYAPSGESAGLATRRSRVQSSPDRQMDDFFSLVLSLTGLLACVADTLNLLIVMFHVIRGPAATHATGFSPTSWNS